MTLRTKLLLAQAPLILALALVCIFSVVIISSLGSYSQTILKDNYRSVLAAQRMKEAIERWKTRRSSCWRAAGGGAQRATEHRQQFENELQVQEGNITEPGEHDVTQRLRALWMNYQEKFDRLRKQRGP